MKIRHLIAACAFFAMTAVAHASLVDWSIYSEDSTFNDTWTGSTVYTYLVTGSSVTDITAFMSSWNTSYEADGTTVFGKKTGTMTSGDQHFMTDVGTGLTAGQGYLVTILLDGDTGIYSWSDYWTTHEQGTAASVDMAYFTEDGYYLDSSAGSDGGEWTEFTTTVPEPTVLALLALGVAGLALRRRA